MTIHSPWVQTTMRHLTDANKWYWQSTSLRRMHTGMTWLVLIWMEHWKSVIGPNVAVTCMFSLSLNYLEMLFCNLCLQINISTADACTLCLSLNSKFPVMTFEALKLHGVSCFTVRKAFRGKFGSLGCTNKNALRLSRYRALPALM